jgi:PKD repeat protein
MVTSSGQTHRLLQIDTFDSFHPTVFSSYAMHSALRALRADVSAYAGSGEQLALELRIADVGDGRRDSAVLVDNLRLVESGTPVARANVDYLEVAVRQTIEFDGSASTDDGTIVEYRWDFGNGYRGFGKSLDFSYIEDGIFQRTLTVTDDDGNTDTATFIVVVGDPNHAPQIVPTPPSIAREGIQYVYQVVADDSELVFGDTLTFSLTEAPEGMGIDPVSGRISWIPPSGVPDSNPVTLRVEDSLGLFDEQSFTVTIDASSFAIVTDDAGRVYYARSNGDRTWANFRQVVQLSG